MTVIRQIGTRTARMQAIIDKFEEYEKKRAWSNVFMVSDFEISVITI
jgi:hypothetical protein